MNGMEMMFNNLLKSQGIDLNEQVQQFKNIGLLIEQFKAQLDRVEANQERLKSQLDLAFKMGVLSAAPDSAETEEHIV